jgi:uncharacterized protein
MQLSPSETRVLGCLLEKQRTTPDAYPLSLNALCLACNQSTNRDPVVEYDQAVVRDALHRLERRGYTRLASGAGSRAPKYRHLLDEALPLDSAEKALMCVLMLRGAQTPGELKQRSERMHSFGDLGDVHAALQRLIGRDLALRRERRPGQKEERYEQLLQADVEGQDRSAAAAFAASTIRSSSVGAYAGEAGESTEHAPGSPDRRTLNGASDAQTETPAVGAVEELSARVARLEREMAALQVSMRHPSSERRP